MDKAIAWGHCTRHSADRPPWSQAGPRIKVTRRQLRGQTRRDDARVQARPGPEVTAPPGVHSPTGPEVAIRARAGRK